MAQVLSFDPHHWQTYCTFSQLSEGGGASLLGLVPTASNSEMLLGQCPQTASSIVSGEMREMQHTNLPQALEQLGGVQALLFLVAKVSTCWGISGSLSTSLSVFSVSLCVSVSLSVSLFLSLHVCLSVCLVVYPSIYFCSSVSLSVCL